MTVWLWRRGSRDRRRPARRRQEPRARGSAPDHRGSDHGTRCSYRGDDHRRRAGEQAADGEHPISAVLTKRPPPPPAPKQENCGAASNPCLALPLKPLTVRYTTYTVHASDPAGRALTYRWTKTNSCGVFRATGASAVWSFPRTGHVPERGAAEGNGQRRRLRRQVRLHGDLSGGLGAGPRADTGLQAGLTQAGRSRSGRLPRRSAAPGGLM